MYLFKHFSWSPRPHGLPRQGDNFIATHYSLLEGKPATWSVWSDGDDLGQRLSGQRGVSPVLNSGCDLPLFDGLMISWGIILAKKYWG